MKYYKIDVNDLVIQVQPNFEDGFKEDATDKVVCGMIDNLDGTFSIVPKTQTELDAIRVSEIDARFIVIDNDSMRSLRELRFTPDDVYAVDKLAAFEIELAALRAERLTLI